jgi:hypothetical protein
VLSCIGIVNAMLQRSTRAPLGGDPPFNQVVEFTCSYDGARMTISVDGKNRF